MAFSITEYVRTTGNLCSCIVVIIKEKQGQYTVWFRSGSDLKLVQSEPSVYDTRDWAAIRSWAKNLAAKAAMG